MLISDESCKKQGMKKGCAILETVRVNSWWGLWYAIDKSGVSEEDAGRAGGDECGLVECDEGKRRRRVKAGTRRGNGDARNQSFSATEWVTEHAGGEGRHERVQVKNARR